MAKRKTPKKEQIVDLKPKAEKITADQLERVQSVINQINRAQLDSINVIQDQLTLIQNEFKEEYGSVDININDGTINYGDVKADKED
mgnify:CR=1 FL=1